MLSEVVDYLSVGTGHVVVDATIGGGRHAEAILESVGPHGQLIGIDKDEDALNQARRYLKDSGSRLTLRQGPFSDLGRILDELGISQVDGILLDLGVSSHQLDTASRGFSFQQDGPLDMRMHQGAQQSAAELLSRLAVREIESILREYGEERFARSIARHIVRRREAGEPVKTTTELKELVERAIPRKNWPKNIHPATRTFQGLRIALNREMQELDSVLEQIPERLKPRGRVCVISYHSLEDRRVKQAFVQAAKGCTCPHGLPVCACGHEPLLKILTRKPLGPSENEIQRNYRSRSAKLRAAERLEN